MITGVIRNFLNQDNINRLAILIPLLLQLSGMVCAVLMDSYIDKRHKRNLLIIAALAFSLTVQNYLEADLASGELRWLFRILVAIYGYTVRPVILVMFMRIVSQGRVYIQGWIMCGVNACVYMTALFTDISFGISKGNHYYGGPLNSFCLYISLALLGYLIFLTIREYIHIRKTEIVIPLVIVALILVALILDGNVGAKHQQVSFTTDVLVSSCVFFYIWLHLQFAREHEDDLKARQSIQIMMTQIQPHFLYNTIATIKALCKKNPDQAAEVSEKFGRYLRQNMDSLDVPGCISLQKELEHTKLYSDIEMVRFENIRVEYDIQDSSFDIPPLSVQPMVENAIRHGMRGREDGLIRVMSRSAETDHEIIIEDNGCGFDIETMKQMDGTHIGIANVKERIEKMCGGTLSIDSKLNEGTVVNIRIPRKREEMS